MFRTIEKQRIQFHPKSARSAVCGQRDVTRNRKNLTIRPTVTYLEDHAATITSASQNSNRIEGIWIDNVPVPSVKQRRFTDTCMGCGGCEPRRGTGYRSNFLS
ncbi:uncharacterized protein LOC116805581 [Drosophila grimshawi]|uniref:uncharacterized protein LOC116805581 n=1 Tax=Drosophila grimshawi TaxID=7222 RepID=UPI0013EF1C4F|nr:uncharacterized protein LOC116805581 [Drosophila grimshawi]